MADTNTGIKFDGGKPQLNLLPYNALGWTARAMEGGALKYEVGNWHGLNHAEGIARIKAALLRHATKSCGDEAEEFDSDSHLPHAAHIICNAMFLLVFADKNNGTSPDRLNDLQKQAMDLCRNLGEEHRARKAAEKARHKSELASASDS